MREQATPFIAEEGVSVLGTRIRRQKKTMGLFIYSLYESELTAVSTLRERGYLYCIYLWSKKRKKLVTVFTPEF